MAAPKKSVPSDKAVLYDKLIATFPEVERKGPANPSTAVNRNMFTLFHQWRTLAIRLPGNEREEFLKKYKTSWFEAYGAVIERVV